MRLNRRVKWRESAGESIAPAAAAVRLLQRRRDIAYPGTHISSEGFPVRGYLLLPDPLPCNTVELRTMREIKFFLARERRRGAREEESDATGTEEYQSILFFRQRQAKCEHDARRNSENPRDCAR